MMRSYSFITDVGLPDIWVMDPKVQFVDDVKHMQEMQLFRVRGIEGVEWAMPMYKGLIKARLTNGNFQTCNVIGLDDTTLIGGPPVMLQGRMDDLRRADAVIVDQAGATEKLSVPGPDGRPTPLQAKQFAPRERKLLSFVLVKARPGQDLDELTARIRQRTGLAAYTQKGFQKLTYDYYMQNTGIPINFGISVALGFLVGAAIAGQTFYSFTLGNLRQFGVLKAMGASNWTLLRMILLQAAVVGSIGYGLGVGLTSLFGWAMRNTILSFKFPWQLLVYSGLGVTLICVFAAFFSIRKVIQLEPAMVFKS